MKRFFQVWHEHAPVPISIVEPDGTYRYVNKKFIETFGYDLNDFKTGREWFSLVYPDPVYRKNVIDTWKSDLEKYKSGTERPEIFTVRCKNGIDREIVFRPVTLSDMKQCIVYEDITEQKNAEHVRHLLSSGVETSPHAVSQKTTKEQPTEPAETMKAEMYRKAGDQEASDPQVKTSGVLNPHYLSSALKMAQDYIAILDRTGKCVWANDALIGAVNAASCTDLEGKSIALYIAPEFRKIALDSLMAIKKTGNKTVQLMMLSSSGRVPVEANFSAINTETGDLFGYMAIARNIGREKVGKNKTMRN